MINRSVFRSAIPAGLLCAALSSIAVAEESLVDWCVKRVKQGLLVPLAKKDEKQSRFSRAAMPPSERRVVVHGDEAKQDGKNRTFVPFSIEVRFGDEGDWQQRFTGCVYRASGAIYVSVGDEYRPSDYLLGKKVEPVAGVCEAPAS